MRVTAGSTADTTLAVSTCKDIKYAEYVAQQFNINQHPNPTPDIYVTVRTLKC